jgi:hypothetical protein
LGMCADRGSTWMHRGSVPQGVVRVRRNQVEYGSCVWIDRHICPRQQLDLE